MTQVKVDSAGAILTVESVGGYAVALVGTPVEVILRPSEAIELGEILIAAAEGVR